MSIQNISKETITSATHTRTQTRNAESSQQDSELAELKRETGPPGDRTISNETENENRIWCRVARRGTTVLHRRSTILHCVLLRKRIHSDTRNNRNIS